MAIDFTGLLGGAGSAASALFPYYAGESILDYLKQARTDLPTQLEGIETGAMGELDFTPYTVTTGLGSTAISPEGMISTTLTPEQQALQQSLLSQAQTLAGTAGPTASELFTQMQEARAPETERQRLALENRLAAQGRLGTQTAMYGGTPEALAMEKAIAEQQSRDILGAQTTAGQLEQQRLSNIGGLLTQAYAPEQQMLSALYGAAPLSGLAESQARSRSQLIRDLGITGLESEYGLLGNIAGFEADRLRAAGQALGGLFASQGEEKSPFEQLLEGTGIDINDWLNEQLGLS
tara:strand:- start:5060 stop:5938 length:879 start_codon:yes stop_codon:yes gene_type:complete